MKNLKILSLAMISLLLAGCGGGNPGTPEVDDNGNTIVKIMFHVDEKSAEGIAYKKLISSFNKQYASEHIKANASFIVRTTGAGDYETSLISLKLDHNLPDIITFDAPNCASYADAEILYDITDSITAEEQADFLSVNKYQNRIYGLPIQESSAGFYYNKNIFRDAGIDVSGYTVDNPWTFDQFKDVCSRLKTKGVTPVDMRLDATKDETGTYLLYPFIYAAGGQFLSEDGLTATGYLDSEKSIKGFQFFKDLLTAQYTSTSIGATDFFTGKVGMYLSSGWTIPELDHNFPNTFPNRDAWGLLPYPKDEKSASATGSWCYGLTDNGIENKEPALKLLKHLTTAESATSVTNATGMIPSRRSCVTNYQPGSPEKVLLDQLDKTGIARPATIGYPVFSTKFLEIIYGLKDTNDVGSLVRTKTASLQEELNRK